MVFSIKTACISETVKVTIDQYGNSYMRFRLVICSITDDLEWHLKVISAYVVIPTSTISEIIYDTSTETELASKKSHGSFHSDTTVDDWRHFKVIFHIKFLLNGM